MALEQSILLGTKKKLGLAPGYTAFDHDVIDYINGAFFRLKTLGLGPPEGFAIDPTKDRRLDRALRVLKRIKLKPWRKK